MPPDTHKYVCVSGEKNVSFSENFAYVLNVIIPSRFQKKFLSNDLIYLKARLKFFEIPKFDQNSRNNIDFFFREIKHPWIFFFLWLVLHVRNIAKIIYTCVHIYASTHLIDHSTFWSSSWIFCSSYAILYLQKQIVN